MTASPALAMTAPAVTTPSVATADAIAVADFAWVNAQRAAAGVPALQVQSWAQGVAQQHSLDMASQGTIFHNISGYMNVGHSAMHATYLGENVAMGTDINYAESALINSAPHRANILDARFNYVGIGAATDAQGQVYITEDFAQIGSAPATDPAPAPAPATPAPAPAPAPKPVVTTPKQAPVVTTPKPVVTTPKPAPVVTTPPAAAPTPASTPKAAAPTASPSATAKAAEDAAPVKLAAQSEKGNRGGEVLYLVLTLVGTTFALGLGYGISRLLGRSA